MATRVNDVSEDSRKKLLMNRRIIKIGEKIKNSIDFAWFLDRYDNFCLNKQKK
jgi:hypothetical protein